MGKETNPAKARQTAEIPPFWVSADRGRKKPEDLVVAWSRGRRKLQVSAS